MRKCDVLGCEEILTKPDHKMCLRHWRAGRDGKLEDCENCGAIFESKLAHCPKCGPVGAANRGDQLSSTKIGRRFGLSAQQMNLVFAELGWTQKGPSNKGWEPTEQGLRRKADQKRASQTGIPYVVWPGQIVEDRVLLSAIEELRAPESSVANEAQPEQDQDFGANRPDKPGTLRAADGHLVRSRGELLIDNWLYMGGILHAYERRLPIEEEAYCDFWLPNGKVYIEYWGLQGKPDYDARRKRKVELYGAHDLSLIELSNDDIDRLDDVLPPRLLRFGVSSK